MPVVGRRSGGDKADPIGAPESAETIPPAVDPEIRGGAKVERKVTDASPLPDVSGITPAVADSRKAAPAEHGEIVAPAVSGTGGGVSPSPADVAESVSTLQDPETPDLLGAVASVPSAKAKNLARKSDELAAELRETRATLSEVMETIERQDRELVKLREERNRAHWEAARYREQAEKKLVELHYNLGVLFQKSERFEEAERAYRDGLDICGDDADIHYNLAILYDEDLQNNKAAINHYKAYLKIRPTGIEARKVRQWLLIAEGDAKYEAK